VSHGRPATAGQPRGWSHAEAIAERVARGVTLAETGRDLGLDWNLVKRRLVTMREHLGLGRRATHVEIANAYLAHLREREAGGAD